jgi:hypothetical protein
LSLLQETLESLAAEGKTGDDVRWVGDRIFWTTWEQFASVADHEYDSGYGSAEVRESLLVVGDDWWLERHEYDGSEWWEFKSLPKMPETQATLLTPFRYGPERNFWTEVKQWEQQQV